MAKTTTKKLNKARSMTDLLDEKFMPKSFSAGDVMEGVIVNVSNSEILVDVGAKSEGIISGSELSGEFGSYKNLKKGDSVLVTVIKPEDYRGYLVLSLRKAEKEKGWRDLQKLFETGDPFEVTVIEYNKGGILVEAKGLRGFVPISHLSKAHFAEFNKATAEVGLRDINKKLIDVLGETLKVKIIEVSREQNRIVLSEKELESAKLEKEVREKLKTIKTGAVLEGFVIAILAFGVLVDCDGVDGLIHISEVSWEKIADLNDIFKIGGKVKVKVISIDKKEGKLGLSIKELLKNPWEGIAKKYPAGAKVSGRISKVMPFGAFLEVEPGIEGLIHISETAGPLNVGDKVSALIISMEPENRKLALSVRKITESKIYK
ncbi:MAG: S1 RNA-binding domain-containing protein [Patescibacteria group bacterium]